MTRVEAGCYGGKSGGLRGDRLPLAKPTRDQLGDQNAALGALVSFLCAEAMGLQPQVPLTGPVSQQGDWAV